MKYRQINTDFWEDDYIASLSDKELKAFIFFFTNKKVNMCGLYEVATRYIRFCLNLEIMEIEKIKQKFEADRKYFFYKDWVYIVNNHQHNEYSSALPIVKAFEKEWSRIPLEVKHYFFQDQHIEYQSPFNPKNVKATLNKDMEMVMEIEKEREKESRVGVRVVNNTDVMNEDIDPEEVERGLAIQEKLRSYEQTN